MKKRILYPLNDGTLSVKELPVRQQPREIAERLGVEQCADDVLLSLLLRTGAAGLNVLDLARNLLRHYGSLAALSEASVSELSEIYGIGKIKAQILKAAFVLGAHAQTEPVDDRPPVRTPDDAAGLLAAVSSGRGTEGFWVLPLDARNRLKGPLIEISSGVLNASLVHPREVFKEAIHRRSCAIILGHNHPSGDPTPSAEDLRITRRLIEAGRILEIDVLDHMIIGAGNRNAHISLREEGLVKF